MVQDNPFDRNIPMADIFTGGYHTVNRSQSRVGDNKDGQAEPSDNIFQIIHRFFIMADRAHDSSAAFHSHIGVRRCHTFPGSHDDILLHGIPFNSCCQMGRYGIPV